MILWFLVRFNPSDSVVLCVLSPFPFPVWPEQEAPGEVQVTTLGRASWFLDRQLWVKWLWASLMGSLRWRRVNVQLCSSRSILCSQMFVFPLAVLVGLTEYIEQILPVHPITV